MKFSRIVLVAMALPVALSGDVPTKAPTSSPNERFDRQRNDAEKDYQHGVQCVEGAGKVKDYITAARYYRRAAEAGYAPAQYDLAYLYENGLGVRKDLKQAAGWYRKAAEQGDPEAQNNLGALYATGRGVPRSYTEAVHWYGMAAQQNDPEGASNLAMMYLKGRGVRRDLERAFHLFRKAADQGYAVAQNNLAMMYANGQAVARDYAFAYAWLDLAAAQLSGCAELRDRIGKEKTSDEIARARDFSTHKRAELELKGKDSK